MNFLHLVRGGAEARTDGPDGFIGHQRPAESLDAVVVEHGGELAPDHLFGTA